MKSLRLSSLLLLALAVSLRATANTAELPPPDAPVDTSSAATEDASTEADTPAGPAIFSQGTKLIYKLSTGGTLLIAIESFPARTGPVKFRYIFSDLGPVGSITMTKEALESATALHNNFDRGDFTLTDKTSVWISQKVFADAKAGRPVTLDLGDDGQATFRLDPEGGGFFPMSFDHERTPNAGGAVETILLRSEDGEKSIRVKDDADAPLILDMDTGSFRVRLSLHL